ncbi:MAG: DSD1 family PLP-dependent enzyme [Boseongicola sp.]|nr:DSD1 family PLP-dependent enzyme [Boseongicola sp.]
MNSTISRRTFLGAGAIGIPVSAAMANTPSERSSASPILLSKPLAIDEVSTPALLVDWDRMESNLKKMAAHSRNKKIGLRPHTKTHKCPIMAKRQMELGAVGVCAAKVSEAEVMVAGGVDKVLITSPVVTPEKISRVVALAKDHPGVQIVVDNAQTITHFNQAAQAEGIVLRVILDLDTGTKRTGIAPGRPALALAQQIDHSRGLQFDGLQAYAGHLMHVKGHANRRRRSLETFAAALETKVMIEKAGIETKTLTGGGTGTFDIDCDIEGVTDLQVGSYLFMDVEYRIIGDVDSDVFDYFDPSLFVLVTTISQPVPDRITVDGGYKAFASDSVKPEFRDVQGLVYHWGGDEHGIVGIQNPSRPVKLGDKLPLIVSHCDPTVNLYDYYHVVRNGQVEELWPIAARGRSQ